MKQYGRVITDVSMFNNTYNDSTETTRRVHI